MIKRRKKRPENKSYWKQTRKTSALRSRKSGIFSGFGRYLAGLVAAWLFIHYIGMPVMDSVKAHPVFTIRSVVVEGAGYIDKEEILKTAAIRQGENIFEIDFTSVSKSLNNSFAAEDFIVFRRLPDTIAICVKERKPVALLNIHDIIGVDSEGVPLPHVGASLIETLPIITGVESISALSDSMVKAKLVTGLKLLERISDESPSVYNRISEVDVSSLSEMGITLIDNGLEVIIGADDWARKIPMLEKVINKVTLGMEKVKAVDIRFAEKIFVRKK